MRNTYSTAHGKVNKNRLQETFFFRSLFVHAPFLNTLHSLDICASFHFTLSLHLLVIHALLCLLLALVQNPSTVQSKVRQQRRLFPLRYPTTTKVSLEYTVFARHSRTFWQGAKLTQSIRLTFHSMPAGLLCFVEDRSTLF